jgi:hypothetical protein
MPVLVGPLTGLALALGAYALVAGTRARQDTRRRRVSAWVPIAVAVGADAHPRHDQRTQRTDHITPYTL